MEISVGKKVNCHQLLGDKQGKEDWMKKLGLAFF